MNEASLNLRTPVDWHARWQRATRRLGAGLALVLWTILAGPQARAETLETATNLFSGSQATDYTINVPTAGALDVTLTDLDWPAPLGNVTLSLTTAKSVLQPMSETGNDPVFSITTPGNYYVHVLGQAGGALNLGAYSLAVTFQPNAVDLPASVWLFLGGLAGLVGLMRFRASLPESASVAAR
jgi:hypothetical protein